MESTVQDAFEGADHEAGEAAKKPSITGVASAYVGCLFLAGFAFLAYTALDHTWVVNAACAIALSVALGGTLKAIAAVTKAVQASR